MGAGEWVQTLALNHATRFAMVQESAEPCLTPQSKEFVHSPNGVDVMMDVCARDSAIHSI